MTHSQTYNQKELFFRIAEGDEVAFKELFVFYTPRLDAFFTRLCKGEAETNELIQEVFIQVWLCRHLLPTVEHPWPWIKGIASHVSYKWLQRRVKQRNLLTGFAASQSADSEGELANLFDLQQQITHAIERLSPQRRKIYVLSRNRGMSISEIAAYLQLSSSTVKNTLVAALDDIRVQLKAAGFDLPLFVLGWILGVPI